MSNDHDSAGTPCEFRPELLPRRGEFFAWGTALLVAVVWAILLFGRQRVIWVVPFFEVFLLLAALAISLGNWMDRHTVLSLSQEDVTFYNGLRHAQLRWDQIQQVQVFPSNWGQKVQVIGEQAHFGFRTLGEMKMQGEVKARMGFAEGDKILEHILANANLKEIEHSGSGYYYSRE